MVERALAVRDETAMRALGAALGRRLAGGTCVLLSGPLGAGKTTLVQGLAAGLGVAGAVASPTFTLIREHPGAPGRPGLVHMDFYRLAGDADVRDLGVADYLAGDDVVAIEWPERAGALAPDDTLSAVIEMPTAGRRVLLSARGAGAEAALAGLELPTGVAAA